MGRPKNTPKDVWKYIDKKGEGECRARGGAKNNRGYGVFMINQVANSSHRLVYKLTHKPIIPPNMQVCHICDNPRCCNPSHLFLGTPKDNMVDKINKGRANYVCGENHPNSKLTLCQVEEIRLLYKTGNYFHKDLGKIYNVSRKNIGDIINHKRWK